MIKNIKLKEAYIIVILITGLLISCTNVEVNEVAVSGRQILVNDVPYTIKGICYHPVPKGSDVRSFETLTQDLALMVDAGINTIRVYEPIDDIEVLNEIHSVGLKVIIGFGYDQNGIYDIKSDTFIDYVNKYKNHEAILLWELGNEFNFHPEWFEDDIQNWYQVLDKAAELIQKNDATHPLTTAHGELPEKSALDSCPNIDVWGMNVYRWDNPTEIFTQWGKLSEKPMYLSEAGGDSYMTITKSGYEKGINEQAQADANANILKSVFENQEICSGVTMFSFADGWWKSGNNDAQDIGGWAPNSTGVPYDGTPNEEYWGIVDINRNKKKAFDVIKVSYTNFTE